MANLNALIAQGYQFQPPVNPFVQYGQMQQLEQGQQTNELNRMKMQEFRRGMEETNALRRLDPASPTYLQDVTRISPEKGFAFAKSQQEAATARLNQEKLKGEVTAQPVKLSADKAKLLDDKLKLSRQFLDTVDPLDPNAPTKYLAWHEANHADPDIGPALTARGVTSDQARMQINAAIEKGPAAFATLLNQSKLGTEKFMEMNKPTTQVVDQSGQRQVLQIPGLGGAPTSVGTYADVPLPANVQAQKLQTAGAGAARQTTNVNTQIPASEEAQKEFMKEMRQTFSALKQAPTVLDNIEKAKALVPQAKGFMGAGGESILQAASFLNNRLGTTIDTKGVQTAEELRSRLFLGIMDNLKKLDSQPSQQQQAALQVALGSIGTDPTALPRVLDVFGETIRQKVDLYNDEALGAESRGVKFPYNPTIKLQPRPGAGGAAAAPNVVVTPDGQSHTFPNAAAAAQFKKAVGL